jgi:hypothetical protein
MTISRNETNSNTITDFGGLQIQNIRMNTLHARIIGQFTRQKNLIQHQLPPSKVQTRRSSQPNVRDAISTPMELLLVVGQIIVTRVSPKTPTIVMSHLLCQ